MPSDIPICHAKLNCTFLEPDKNRAAWRGYDNTQDEADATNRRRALAIYEKYRPGGIAKIKTPAT